MSKIKVGDVVKVDFHNAQITLSHKAEVIYMPCQTGDSWVFEDLNNGTIYYVSEGCTLTKLGLTHE